MRRAAVSIPAKVAEGFKRRGKADKARFMNIAEDRLKRSRYSPILSHDPGYGGPQEGRMNLLEEVSRLLNAYAKAILASGFYPAAFGGELKAEPLPWLELG